MVNAGREARIPPKTHTGAGLPGRQ